MSEDSDERNQVREFISSAVADHWSATGRALLLSTLGGQVRRRFPDSHNILPEGLRKFLDQWPTVRIVGHPTIREKVGAIPLECDVPEDVYRVFEPDHLQFERPQQPRYLREFWIAFHTRIEGRRFVIPPSSDQAIARIVDVPNGESAPDGYEILPTDLSLLPPEASLTEKVQTTLKKIREWLHRNGLSENLFTYRATAFPVATLQRTTERSEVSVAYALSKLEPSDQARIFIPLDIVAKIIANLR